MQQMRRMSAELFHMLKEAQDIKAYLQLRMSTLVDPIR
jgi:hypothetical protein